MMHLVLAALALLAHGGSLPAEKTLSMTEQALSIKALLPKLSEATGTTLEASPTTESEIVCLRFQEVPVEVALAKLAEAVDGTWKPEGKGFRLVRGAEQVRAEQAEHDQKLLLQIQKELDSKQANLRKQGVFDKEHAEALATRAASMLKSFNPNDHTGNFYQRWQTVSDAIPGHRSIAMILQTFSAGELASIAPQTKVMYSNRPTPTERQLNPAAESVLAGFAQELAVWNEAKLARGVRPPEFNGMTYNFEGVGDDVDTDDPARTPGRPTRVLLAVSRISEGADFNVEATFLDANYRRVGGASTMLSRFEESDEEDIAKPKEPSPNELVIDPTPISRELDELAQSGGSTISDETRAQLLDPVGCDPLSLLASPPLIQYAEKNNLNLVACLSDGAYVYGSLTRKAIPVSQFVTILRLLSPSFEERDGWAMLKMEDPIQNRKSRVDRRALAGYLRAQVSGMRLSLEDRATMVYQLPDPEANRLPDMLAALLDGRPDGYDSSPQMLRLYGSMNALQRSMLRTDGVAIQALNADQRAIVDQMVYGPWVNLELRMDALGKAPEGFSQDAFYAGMYNWPTEAMPNGYSANGRIRLTEKDGPVVFTSPQRYADYTMPGQAMGPDELAWQMYCQDNLDKFPWMSEQRIDLNKLRVGSQRTLTFEFDLTNAIKLTQTLHDNNLGREQVGYKGLPADFRKLVEDRLESYKHSYPNEESGATGGNNGPP